MHKSKQAEFPHKNLTRVNKICPLEQTLHVCIWRYRAANPNPNYTDPKQQGFIFNPCRRFGIFFSFFFSHILPASREAVKAIWAHAGAELLMKHG